MAFFGNWFNRYPGTDFSQINLDWIISELRKNIGKINVLEASQAELKEWVENYLRNINVTETVAAAIDEMIADGTFYTNVFSYLPTVTPQMYGAVGDGTTVDDAAFNSALASGKLVYVPSATYKLDNYIFSDDSIVRSDKGVYNNKKLIISKDLKHNNMLFRDNYTIRYDVVSPIVDSVQGVSYNSDRNSIIFCDYSVTAETVVRLIEVNADDFSLLNSVSVTGLGHGNDITYNAVTKKFYCATSRAAGELAVINTALNVEQYITIPGLPYAPTIIAYDPDNNIYYTGTMQGVQRIDVLNADFEIIHTLPTLDLSRYLVNTHGNGPVYAQGGFVYHGTFYMCVAMYGDASGVMAWGKFGSWSYTDGSVKNMIEMLCRSNGELEACEVIKGQIWTFTHNRPFSGLMVTKYDPMTIEQAVVNSRVNLEYTANNYISQTSLGRCFAYVNEATLEATLQINLNIDAAALPTNTSAVIGKLPFIPRFDFATMIPIQNNGNHVLLSVSAVGVITIANYSGESLSGFCRSMLNIPITHHV